MRRIVIMIIALLAVAYVAYSFAELQNILAVLRDSDPLFLLGAIVLEIVCMYNTAATFGALYRLVGLRESRRQLFLMAMAANFVNVIAPSAGAGGIAVFLDEAGRQKMSTARVMVVGVLYLVYEYASLFCVLALGFIVLSRRNNITMGEVIAAGALLLLALAVGAVLVLGYRAPHVLGEVLAWLSRLVNRILRPFLRRDYLAVENARKFASEMAEGIVTIRGSRGNLVWPFLFTLNNKALLICILAFTFLALSTPFTIDTLVGGFSISYLFFYMSITPSGVGVVEGVLPAALNALRVPLTRAVLITLVFRAVTLWLPLAVGAVAFRTLQKRAQAASPGSGSSPV